MAYEWSKHRDLVQPTLEDELPPAPQDELDGLVRHFEELLEPKGYFRPPARAGATRRTLRGLLTKPGWNHLRGADAARRAVGARQETARISKGIVLALPNRARSTGEL